MKIITYGSSSAGNSYLLKDRGSTVLGDSALLLEAGINPKKMKLDWSKVAGLLISHEHLDHSKYAKDVVARTAFDIWCTKGTAQNLVGVPEYRIKEVESKEGFSIREWNIMPFDIEHDAAEPVGFLIETPSRKRVLFATDTYYIRYKFKGITHMMLECNYSLGVLQDNYESGRIDKGRYNRLLTSHFELNNVKQFLKANDLSSLEEIHLLHLSDSNADAEYFKTEIQKVAGVPVYIAGGD